MYFLRMFDAALTLLRRAAIIACGSDTMIAQLRGTLGDKRPNQVLVDVGGVGYLVHIPLGYSFFQLVRTGESTQPALLRAGALLGVMPGS